MGRWIIKHNPSGKAYCENEGGAYLVDLKEGIISWGDKPNADSYFDCLLDNLEDENSDMVFTENGEFHIDEFEVCEI